MARKAWLGWVAAALVACGGSEGDAGLFGVDEADAGHDGAGGSGDVDSGGDADGGEGGSGGGERVCAPGKVEACACPGGGQGAQACRQDGAGWEPCECSDGAGGSGGASDAGPDAPPDTSGWKWWCNGDSNFCQCDYAATGERSRASCPQVTTCCWQKSTNGVPDWCRCNDTQMGLHCDLIAESAGAVVVTQCP